MYEETLEKKIIVHSKFDKGKMQSILILSIIDFSFSHESWFFWYAFNIADTPIYMVIRI